MIFPNPIEFARAVGRIIEALLTGRKLVVERYVARYRLDECMMRSGDCYDCLTSQCKVCSCFTGAKVWFATEKCPRGHWGRDLFKTEPLS